MNNRIVKLVSSVLTTAASILVPTSALHAQSMPSITQGKPYASERQKLLAAGWQKVMYPTRSCNQLNGFSRDTCFAYQELDTCSANGYCSFIWRTAYGGSLRVNTYGYDYNVVNWILE